MSINQNSLLQILPVEILHHIFDNLDPQTILFSIRNTCHQLRAVVNTYTRYRLNFQSISKPDFDHVCHLIEPCRVISLTLSEDEETFDQIKLFLSNFNLRQFNRLHSLSLFINEEEQLKTIVERFRICSLKSFSLKIQRSDDRRKTTTAKLLSTIIAKSDLSKLELHMQEGRFEKILWPAKYSVKYLKINNTISFDRMSNILLCSPHLRTVIINSLCMTNPNQSISTSFCQLTSLTLTKVNDKIDKLELFLSMMSSLTHLKLIGNGNYCDGHRWEQFIQLHLPLLNKFEFFFNETQHVQQTHLNIEQIIAPFKTPFWLEDKKWFVICDLDTDTSRRITLYSIPVCVPFLSYETKTISVSTLPPLIHKNNSIMDYVETVRLDFTKLMFLNTKNEDTISNDPLFRNIRRLELHFDTARPHDWAAFVSNLIDLKTIAQVTVSSTSIRQCNPYMLAEMTKLLQQTSYVSSVDICYGFLSRQSRLTAAELSLMLPSHVKHLAVSIKDLNEIKHICNRFQNLSSANFYYDYTPSWKEITYWFDVRKKGSSYQADSFSVCVWLGKSDNQPNEIKVTNKRIKLN